MSSLDQIPELRRGLIHTANQLLEYYPGIPVLDRNAHPLTIIYSDLICEILASVPLDPGTKENKRNDARRRIDEFDDGSTISAKEFILLKSSAELGQGLGQHRHEQTGVSDGSSRFVEGFRMVSSSGIIFVCQYTRDAVCGLVAGPTTVHPIHPGNIVVLEKNQAHTLFLEPGMFQGVLPTTFTVEDLIESKLAFSK